MVERSSSTETPHHEPGLSRQLGLTTATALVVAEVIGVGIFLTTAGMVKSLGSPFWLLTIWLTTGVAAAGERSASAPWRRGVRRPAGRMFTSPCLLWSSWGSLCWSSNVIE